MPDTKSKTSGLQMPNGRPDTATLTKRKEIVRLSMEELHRRLTDPEDKKLVEGAVLTNICKVFDDDLRVNKTELTVREPLVVKVVRDEPG